MQRKGGGTVDGSIERRGIPHKFPNLYPKETNILHSPSLDVYSGRHSTTYGISNIRDTAEGSRMQGFNTPFFNGGWGIP